MKNKTVKSILPILLTFLLFFSTIPISVFASGEFPDSSVPSSSVIGGSPGDEDSSTLDDSSIPADVIEDDSDAPSEEEIPPDSSDSEEPEPPVDPAQEPVIIPLDHIIVTREDSRARASAQMTLRRYDGIRWNFDKTGATVNEHPWYLVDIDGAVAYCVEPLNPTSNDGIYTTFTYEYLTTDQRYAIGYAMLYGAKDTRDPLYHMATQLIIWEIIYSYLDLSTFQPTGNRVLYNNTIGYNSYNMQADVNYRQILSDMRRHKEVPSFMSSVEPGMPVHTIPGVPGAYEVTLTNTNPNASLTDFYFADSDTLTFTKNGENLTIRSTGALANAAYAAYKGSTGYTDALIYWGNGNNQVRATAGSVTPVPAYFRLSTQDVASGQISIYKTAAADSELTGITQGSELAGAVFEILDENRAVVDILTTGADGAALSKMLPLGRYMVREIAVPVYWLLNTTVFEVTLAEHGCVVPLEVINEPVRISTTVDKSGVVETKSGEVICYDFKDIANTSNVPLDDFYWRDTLPTDAARLETIYTGTWSQLLTYRVWYRTNLDDQYRLLAGGLSSDTAAFIDCRPETIGLSTSEYITEFYFDFGTVEAGFRELSRPKVFVKVLDGLPDGYRFTNRTDVGGRYEDEWVYDKDCWTTTVYITPLPTLPETGALE